MLPSAPAAIRMRTLLSSLLVVIAAATATGAQRSSPAPSAASAVPLRLYVFDCGTLDTADMSRYHMTRNEVATTRLSVACFLVVHPRGTLMWDVGGVPDDAWQPTGSAVTQAFTLPDGQQREVTLRRPLIAQLTEAGFAPERITYLAFSHYHWDHTANANRFARATWIARPVERQAMFAASAPALTQPSTYAALRGSRTIPITANDYDLFGDGSVVMKLAPGHTPGHQVLALRLPHTGLVVLSGDLYHYPEERALGRVPAFDVDQAQTRASRAAIEAFVKRGGGQLWIQHDFAANARLKKSPAYYD